MINKFVTHSWKFHLDELMSYTIISLLEENEVELVRTRNTNIINPELLNKNTLVADVWLELNEDLNNLDHHFFDENLITYSLDNNKYQSYGALISITFIETLKQINIIDKIYNLMESKNFSLKLIQNSIKSIIDNNNMNFDINILEQDNLLEFINNIILQLSENFPKLLVLFKNNLNNIYLEFRYNFILNIKYRKYSSAWLTWKYFWKELVSYILIYTDLIKEYNDEIIEVIYYVFNKMDNDIFYFIDLEDNWFISSKKNNIFWQLQLSSIINSFNGIDLSDEQAQYENFILASELLEKILYTQIKKYYFEYLNKEKIENIINNIEDYEILPNIIYIENYIPWIEKYLNWIKNKDYLWIIYSNSNPEWWYYIKSITKSNQVWDYKKLPQDWVENKNLIDWLLFCHPWRFLALFNNIDNLLLNIKMSKFNI